MSRLDCSFPKGSCHVQQFGLGRIVVPHRKLSRIYLDLVRVSFVWPEMERKVTVNFCVIRHLVKLARKSTLLNQASRALKKGEVKKRKRRGHLDSSSLSLSAKSSHVTCGSVCLSGL